MVHPRQSGGEARDDLPRVRPACPGDVRGGNLLGALLADQDELVVDRHRLPGDIRDVGHDRVHRDVADERDAPPADEGLRPVRQRARPAVAIADRQRGDSALAGRGERRPVADAAAGGQIRDPDGPGTQRQARPKARGLGAIIGPILFRRVLNKPTWLLPGLALSMTAYGLAYMGVAFATWFPLVLVGVFFAHIAGGGNWVMSNYAIQQAVPDDLRGRVSATDTMIAMLAITVSQLVVGLYVDSVSTTALFVCCGATTMSYAIGWYLFTRRYVIRRPEPVPAS